MRIELRLDQYVFMVDSRDPDLLARWLIEQFTMWEWTPATQCRVQCWPSFSPRTTGAVRADWIQDARYFEQWSIKTPRELVDAMGRALDALEHDQPRRS